jgi:hypothetical protein
MLELLLDLHQSSRIRELENDVANAKIDAANSAQRQVDIPLERFSQQLDRITLATAAMWSLIQERTGITEADLKKRIIKLDEADGKRDGRITKKPIKCSKCDSHICQKFHRCLMCGAEYEGGSAFQTI